MKPWTAQEIAAGLVRQYQYNGDPIVCGIAIGEVEFPIERERWGSMDDIVVSIREEVVNVLAAHGEDEYRRGVKSENERIQAYMLLWKGECETLREELHDLRLKGIIEELSGFDPTPLVTCIRDAAIVGERPIETVCRLVRERDAAHLSERAHAASEAAERARCAKIARDNGDDVTADMIEGIGP